MTGRLAALTTLAVMAGAQISFAQSPRGSVRPASTGLSGAPVAPRATSWPLSAPEIGLPPAAVRRDPGSVAPSAVAAPAESARPAAEALSSADAAISPIEAEAPAAQPEGAAERGPDPETELRRFWDGARGESEGLRVLVTGATSGLGRELAVQLGRQGHRVAITGRRRDRLLETSREISAAGGVPLPLVGSVTELGEVRAQYAKIREAWGGLDRAILNAGVPGHMDAREFQADTYHRVFATNVGGVVNWIDAALPDMLAARSGVIAAIASLAAYRGLPATGAYSASKAAVATLLESTRVDLRGTGVDIVTVSPGFIKSEITAGSSLPFMLETADAAARVLRGIERRSRTVYFPWQLSLPVRWIVRNLPDGVYDVLLDLGRGRKDG